MLEQISPTTFLEIPLKSLARILKDMTMAMTMRNNQTNSAVMLCLLLHENKHPITSQQCSTRETK